MCGIVGYIGTENAVPILLGGLQRLEYRGYDSSGLACHTGDRIVCCRAAGKLRQLETVVADTIAADGKSGIGHTRWATHGPPTLENAHPHRDCSGELALVHNGIIENHAFLKRELQARGHIFSSETDTEVIVHLIEESLEDDLVAAVRKALAMVEGSYALGVLWSREPGLLVAARNQSPLVVGLGDDGCYIASDIPALLPYTREVIFLDDQELAVLGKTSCVVSTIGDETPLKKESQSILWDAEMAEKGGYRHFMLKEIYEQPRAILDTVNGRIDPDTGMIDLPGIGLSLEELQKIKRIVLLACGTSWHAALVAKQWLEKWVGMPVDVDISSEFRYRALLLNEQVLTISLSQSGETADTLAGIRLAKELGSKVVAISNVVGSTMSREADGVIYTHAGPEIGVAATKTFLAQLTALFLLTLYLGRIRQAIDQKQLQTMGRALLGIAAVIERELPRLHGELQSLIEGYVDCRDFIFVGRGMNFPIALEGALKLKEVSYIHAEGCAAGELKHGPIALLDPQIAVVAIVPDDSVYRKMLSNVEEIRARHGRLLLFGTRNDPCLEGLSEEVLYLPEVLEELNPLLYTVPAQLFSYEMARFRGCDVDQPRNLAKSVTVE